MSTNSPFLDFFDDSESAILFAFLEEKSKNAVAPLSIWNLCFEFKKQKGSRETVIKLIERIERNRYKIPKMTWLDMDTQVRMIFASSATVTAQALNKFRTNAKIILDASHRITEYYKKDGSLHLQGRHTINVRTNSLSDRKMMYFLAEKSKNLGIPMNSSLFITEFMKTNELSDYNGLWKRYQFLRNEIEEMTEFDEETRIRMQFVSGAMLRDDYLEELREHADVDVDEYKRIIKYKADDGSFELEYSDPGPNNGSGATDKKKEEELSKSNKIAPDPPSQGSSPSSSTPQPQRAVYSERGANHNEKVEKKKKEASRSSKRAPDSSIQGQSSSSSTPQQPKRAHKWRIPNEQNWDLRWNTTRGVSREEDDEFMILEDGEYRSDESDLHEGFEVGAEKKPVEPTQKYRNSYLDMSGPLIVEQAVKMKANKDMRKTKKTEIWKEIQKKYGMEDSDYDEPFLVEDTDDRASEGSESAQDSPEDGEIIEESPEHHPVAQLAPRAHLEDLDFDEPSREPDNDSVPKIAEVQRENSQIRNNFGLGPDWEDLDFEEPFVVKDTDDGAQEGSESAENGLEIVKKSSEHHPEAVPNQSSNSSQNGPRIDEPMAPKKVINNPKFEEPPGNLGAHKFISKWPKVVKKRFNSVPVTIIEEPGAPISLKPNPEDSDEPRHKNPKLAQSSQRTAQVTVDSAQISQQDPSGTEDGSAEDFTIRDRFVDYDVEMSPVEQEIEVETEEMEQDDALQKENQVENAESGALQIENHVGNEKNGALQIETQVENEKSGALQIEENQIGFDDGGQSVEQWENKGSGALQIQGDHIESDNGEESPKTVIILEDHMETEKNGALQLEDHMETENNGGEALQIEKDNIESEHDGHAQNSQEGALQIENQKGGGALQLKDNTYGQKEPEHADNNVQMERNPDYLAPKSLGSGPPAEPMNEEEPTRTGVESIASTATPSGPKSVPSTLSRVTAKHEPTTGSNLVPKLELAAPGASENGLISISTHVTLLEAIQNVITMLDIPQLQELEERIKRRIEKLGQFGNRGEKVTHSDTRAAILASCLILSKSIKVSNDVDSESINLKELLIIYRTSLITLRLPCLEPCHQKFKGMIRDVEPNKEIPVEKVVSAIQIVVEYIAP